MRAAARGDEAAFARLWRDSQPPLLRYLRVVSGKAAEDVASEVWLEVSRRLPRFRGGEGEFRAWLFTTARRRVIDLRRYTARRPELLAGEPGELERRAPDDTAGAALERISTDAALALIASAASRLAAGADTPRLARRHPRPVPEASSPRRSLPGRRRRPRPRHTARRRRKPYRPRPSKRLSPPSPARTRAGRRRRLRPHAPGSP